LGLSLFYFSALFFFSFNFTQTNAVNGTEIGERSPEIGPGADVIIVGACVAGAALAHTLGKSKFRFKEMAKKNLDSKR
ncbi:squalene monooxygenase-like protein, partial [Corchorus capsularis]